MDKEEVKNNLKFALKILKIVIIIIIKLSFSRFLSELALLPSILYKELVVYVPFKTILLISISTFIYVNWAIWTKGVARKVLMFIVMFFYLIIGAILFSELAGIQSDYCIEDGDCEEICIEGILLMRNTAKNSMVNGL